VAYLMRVSLPDVPGSLGRVATAIGEAGGDIEAIEIVDKSRAGWAVDDVILALADGTMPDSIISACTDLEDVEVLWISRYAGGQLFLDLEVVEAMTDDPEQAVERLPQLCLDAFRADWAAILDADSTHHATSGAPGTIPFREEEEQMEDDDLVLCSSPLGDGRSLVLARSGGPEFLDSEVARIGHLAKLAVSISR
jgi:hypothetical protein